MPADDHAAFEHHLRTGGLRSALTFLNGRTPHRFTAVLRYDGDMLRSVALIDKWDAAVERGEDIPLEQAYCAILHRDGEPLEVLDSKSDDRFPNLRDSPVISYCGALIEDPEGNPFGALCHYDLQPVQTRISDMPLLVAAARLLYSVVGSPGTARDTNSAISLPSPPPR